MYIYQRTHFCMSSGWSFY